MSCKPTECKECHGHFPACQIREGMCMACWSKLHPKPQEPAPKKEEKR